MKFNKHDRVLLTKASKLSQILLTDELQVMENNVAHIGPPVALQRGAANSIKGKGKVFQLFIYAKGRWALYNTKMKRASFSAPRI